MNDISLPPFLEPGVAIASALASGIVFIVRGISLCEERLRDHVAEVRGELGARIEAVEKRHEVSLAEIRTDLKRIEAILVSVQIGIAALPRREDPA